MGSSFGLGSSVQKWGQGPYEEDSSHEGLLSLLRLEPGSELLRASWVSSQAHGALPHSTMMGKLPLGVVSPYVKMSSGGCSDPLKFYATSYCTSYGEDPLCGSYLQDPGWERARRGTVSRSILPQ